MKCFFLGGSEHGGFHFLLSPVGDLLVLVVPEFILVAHPPRLPPRLALEAL